MRLYDDAVARKLLHTVASGSDGVDETPAARIFTDTEDHELVQRRLGLVYGLVGRAVLVMFVMGVIFTAAFWREQFWAIHLSAMKALHLVLGGALLYVSHRCKGPLRSSAQLSAFDLLGFAFVLIGAGVMLLVGPKGLRLEFMLVPPLILICLLRAALVPSPPRWTVLVTAVGVSTAPVMSWLIAAHDPEINPVIRGSVPIIVFTWCVVTVVASYAVSRVVYGLRVDAKRATRLGQYTLEDKIGEGGMGVVYRARHSLLRRPTAIKLLANDRKGATDIRRFEREVQLTSALTHPNTIAIYDFGHTRDGVFYYAMEHLDGISLHDLVERDGPQPAARVIHVLIQLAGALAEAHDVGLIHRDVKPANIFLCHRGGMPDFVKVLDFGLVKETVEAGTGKNPMLSQTNAIAGTPHYMAPESIVSPGEIDSRVDIYAFGGVGYFLLTGTTPFDGSNLVEICSHHLHSAVERPSLRAKIDVPESLENLLLECLAKSPDGRPATARDVIRKLEACQRECTWDLEAARNWWKKESAKHAAQSVS